MCLGRFAYPEDIPRSRSVKAKCGMSVEFGSQWHLKLAAVLRIVRAILKMSRTQLFLRPHRFGDPDTND